MEAPAPALEPSTEVYVPAGASDEVRRHGEGVRVRIGTIVPPQLTLPDGRTAVRTKRTRGGFGEIWTIEEPQSGERFIAKFPRIFSDPERSRSALNAIFREGVLLAELRIPGVPRLLDMGMDGGRPYLLLPRIEGMTWRAVLRTRRRCCDHAWLERMAELALTLGRLHAGGVVHGDVKPGNVLFGRDAPEEKPRTWLIDFGLASRVSDERRNDAYRGCTLGTRGYLDPRMIGRAHLRDAAADVYALGVMLYEGYTWQSLFPSALWSAVLEHQKTHPCTVVPAARSLIRGQLLRFEQMPQPERRPDLEALIARILLPGTRPPDAGETAAMLRSIIP